VPALTALRYSARSFARAPGSSLALFVTIALGIGGNASVVGFIRGSVAFASGRLDRSRAMDSCLIGGGVSSAPRAERCYRL
jgi:hypothetical protein